MPLSSVAVELILAYQIFQIADYIFINFVIYRQQNCRKLMLILLDIIRLIIYDQRTLLNERIGTVNKG